MTPEEAFIFSCLEGHLHIAQLLLHMKPTIDISVCNDFAFTWSCAHGHLHVAKWLLQIKPIIDISAYEQAFIFSCSAGHLHIAQWLLQIKPTIDIFAYDDYAFRKACGRGHSHVAQWLKSLMPFKYVIDTLYEPIIHSEYDCYALTIITLLKKTGYDSFINANLLCTIAKR